MNGIVLGLVREALCGEYGSAVWESILTPAVGAEGSGRAGSAQAQGLADRDLPSEALVCWYGRRAVSLLGERHPRLLDRHPDPGSFVRSLTGGSEARPPAGPIEGIPGLACHPAPDGGTLIAVEENGVGSRACALLKGLVAGAALHYGREVELRELKCVGHGDNRCLLHVAPAMPEASPVGRERTARRGRRAAGLG